MHVPHRHHTHVPHLHVQAIAAKDAAAKALKAAAKAAKDTGSNVLKATGKALKSTKLFSKIWKNDLPPAFFPRDEGREIIIRAGKVMVQGKGKKRAFKERGVKWPIAQGLEECQVCTTSLDCHDGPAALFWTAMGWFQVALVENARGRL